MGPLKDGPLQFIHGLRGDLQVAFATYWVHKNSFLPAKCLRLRPAKVRYSVAHKNAWIKRKDDLCSHPPFGVARRSVTNDVCLWGTALHVSGSSKRSDREGFGQGLSNEAIFSYFRTFDLVFVYILSVCSNSVVRGAV